MIFLYPFGGFFFVLTAFYTWHKSIKRKQTKIGRNEPESYRMLFFAGGILAMVVAEVIASRAR